MVLLFCADCQKWYDLYQAKGAEPRKPGVGDLILAINDATIAAQNAVTAAWSLGIGSCYIGDIMEQYETIHSILKLPDYVFPAVLLVFGYPTDQQKNRIKPERAPMDVIVQTDTYHSLSAEELDLMISKRLGKQTPEEYTKAFCLRKYNSDFSKEMTRSVEEYLKSFNQE